MRQVAISALTAGFALIAVPAFAIDVDRSGTVDAAPDAVWSTIGDFCGIADWHPAVQSCEESEADGNKRRTLTLVGGGTLVEDEVSRDDDAMSYTYRIVEGPLPVEDYESTISVSGDGESSTVEWQGNFDAQGVSDDEAMNVITGIYDAGIKGIAERAARM